MTLESILDNAGRKAVDQIKANLVASGENTTGKTAESLRWEISGAEGKVTLSIIGREFFKATETGTKPSTKNPSPEMVESLTEWAQAKGVEAKPYAIAKSILKKGSKLWRQGGRKDIYSNVVPTLVEEIKDGIAKNFKNGFNRS